MRILFALAAAFPGTSAPANRMSRMARAVSNAGCEVEFAAVATGQTECRWPIHPFTPRRSLLPGYPGRVRRDRFFSRRIGEILSAKPFDAVVCLTASWLCAGDLPQIARRHNCRLVYDMVEWFGFSWWRWASGQLLDGRLLRACSLPRTDGIIGISHGWCHWADRRGIANVWIPSLAEDRGCVRTQPSPAGRPFTLAFIGHWIARELPITFLRAMRICLDRGVDVRMHVLGNVGKSMRERPPMRMLARDPALARQVSFLGFVDDAERDRQLADADAFIILRPDSRETDMLFPTRLPEYMLSGNPVILSKTGCFPQCFEHGKDVWFVSARNDPGEIADAMIYLAEHPEERLALGLRGRQGALRQFSLDVLGRRLADFLEELASRPGRAGS